MEQHCRKQAQRDGDSVYSASALGRSLLDVLCHHSRNSRKTGIPPMWRLARVVYLLHRVSVPTVTYNYSCISSIAPNLASDSASTPDVNRRILQFVTGSGAFLRVVTTKSYPAEERAPKSMTCRASRRKCLLLWSVGSRPFAAATHKTEP